MNNAIKSALSAFGLTPNEVTIYLETLKSSETNPYALARATKIPRTSVYDILLNLSLKGLIELHQSDGYSKQQTKIRAKNPSILRTILDSKRQTLTDTEVDIVHILPHLQGDYLQHHQSADFQFLPGAEGIKHVYAVQRQSPEPVMVWENMMPMDILGPKKINDYSQKETQANLTQHRRHRELIPLTKWTRHVLSYQFALDPNYIKAREIRYIDHPLFDNHLTITIQGKRLLLACAHQDEVYGLILTSNALTDTLKAMFEIQWLTAVPITDELIKSWGPNAYRQAEMKKAHR